MNPNYHFNVLFIREFVDIPIGTRAQAYAENGEWVAELYDGRIVRVPPKYLTYSNVQHTHFLIETVAPGVEVNKGPVLLLAEFGDQAIIKHVNFNEQVTVERKHLLRDRTTPVVSVQDFEVGKYYHAVDVLFGRIEVVECKCDSTTVPEGYQYKYLGERFWAHPENQAAMTRWVEFREIEAPHQLKQVSFYLSQSKPSGEPLCQ